MNFERKGDYKLKAIIIIDTENIIIDTVSCYYRVLITAMRQKSDSRMHIKTRTNKKTTTATVHSVHIKTNKPFHPLIDLP